MKYRMTIREYIDDSKGITLFPFWLHATKPDCVIDPNFQNDLTPFIRREFGDYVLSKRFMDFCVASDDIVSLTKLIQEVCDNIYEVHAYEYQRIFDTMGLEYDPISNYDLTEIEDTKNSGSDTTTTKAESYTDTTNQGGTSATDAWGEQTVDGVSRYEKTPFESQSYQNYSSDTDVNTRQAYQDTHTTSPIESRFQGGERNGSNTLQHGHNINRKLTRKGNIGVTTSQQMIESERKVALLNFVRIVATDVTQAICMTYKGVRL